MAKDAMLDESTRRLVAVEQKQELLNYRENLKSIRKPLTSTVLANFGHTISKPHLEKVFSNVKQRHGLSPGDKMENLDVNEATWRIFMSVTLQAADHIGKDYFDQESAQTIIETVVSSKTGTVITDQIEITGIPLIDWQ